MRTNNSDPVDLEVSRLASRQHGVVCARQLYELGLSRTMISYRIRKGALIKLHRGVFAVGHSVLPHGGREMAAVLACGEGALLSHWSAAFVWGMSKWTATKWPVDVSVMNGRPRHSGVRTHQIQRLWHKDCQEVLGIPITSPERTLVDMAAKVGRATLTRLLNEGRILDIVDAEEVDQAIARYPRRPGVVTLRQIVQRLASTGITRSGSEDRMQDLIEAHSLPPARTNVPLLGYEVDVLWLDHRVIVEVDGEPFHNTPDAVDRDKRRDSFFASNDFVVLRFASEDVRESPHRIADEIRRTLNHRRVDS